MSEEPQAASESANAATRAARRVEDPRDTVEGYCCGNKSVKNWQARFQPVPLASTIGWFQRRSSRLYRRGWVSAPRITGHEGDAGTSLRAASRSLKTAGGAPSH